MDIQEIIDRNYKATVRRGLITDKTYFNDFFDKLDEEIEELWRSNCILELINGFDSKELADVALVCFAMAKHFDVDLLKAMEEKMLYNENRED